MEMRKIREFTVEKLENIEKTNKPNLRPNQGVVQDPKTMRLNLSIFQQRAATKPESRGIVIESL